MTVLEAIKKHISACPDLDYLANAINTDWLNRTDATDYGIFNGGDVILQTYMDGGSRKQQTFYIQSSQMGREDALRMDNSAEVENIQNWINDRQFEEFTMPENCEFERITVGNGTPIDVSEDGEVYIYRITGNLLYERTL